MKIQAIKPGTQVKLLGSTEDQYSEPKWGIITDWTLKSSGHLFFGVSYWSDGERIEESMERFEFEPEPRAETETIEVDLEEINE